MKHPEQHLQTSKKFLIIAPVHKQDFFTSHFQSLRAVQMVQGVILVLISALSHHWGVVDVIASAYQELQIDRQFHVSGANIFN
jgi:hypothetical protein